MRNITIDPSEEEGLVAQIREGRDRIYRELSKTIVGQKDVIEQLLICLFSGSHCLITGAPGLAKTLLVRSVAQVFHLEFRRIQFTPDLMPADITGTEILDEVDGRRVLQFVQGPVFANVLLVDEINRASPRTQSALLQPMEEHQVTIDGTTWPLPAPFFCIATQNPFGQVGTFPLPESQLDRFSLVLSLGLPDREAEREIVTGAGGVDLLGKIQPVTDPQEVAEAITATAALYCNDAVVDYILDLSEATRTEARLSQGVSPRASSSLLRLSQGHAAVSGRDYVTPDDVQAVFVAAFAHRVMVADRVDTAAATQVLAWMLTQVPVPRV